MRIRGRFLLFGGLFTLAQLLVGEVSPAAAAPGADALVAHGIELRKQGKDDEALAEFQKALQLEPTPRTRAQAALAEQALGLWVAAEADLMDALSHDSDAWVKKNAPVLTKALTVIQSQLATLQVWGTPVGASVFVNGKPAGSLPLKKPIRVSGESVVVTVSADGYVDIQRTVRVPPKETVREHVELVPVAARTARSFPEDDARKTAAPSETKVDVVPAALPSDPTASGSSGPTGSQVSDRPAGTSSSVLRPLAWGTAVAAAGALTFGIVETVLRGRNRDAFNNYAKPNLTDPANPTRNYCNEANLPPECQGLKDKFDSSTRWMIVGYASAGVLALGSGILFAVSSGGTDGDQHAAVACLPHLGSPGLSCRLTF